MEVVIHGSGPNGSCNVCTVVLRLCRPNLRPQRIHASFLPVVDRFVSDSVSSVLLATVLFAPHLRRLQPLPVAIHIGVGEIVARSAPYDFYAAAVLLR